MPRLIIFAPNWVGDAVMAQPAIADVRRAFDGVIAVVARPAVAPVVSMIPGIDETIPLERGRVSFLNLSRPPFDAALLMPNSLHSAVMAFRARIPERWGYRTDCRSALLTRGVAPEPA